MTNNSTAADDRISMDYCDENGVRVMTMQMLKAYADVKGNNNKRGGG